MAKNIIWTDHGIKKKKDAGLEKWQAEKALTNPTRIQKSTAPGCKNYVRVRNHVEVGVSAKKTDDNHWLIVSAWKRKLY